MQLHHEGLLLKTGFVLSQPAVFMPASFEKCTFWEVQVTSKSLKALLMSDNSNVSWISFQRYKIFIPIGNPTIEAFDTGCGPSCYVFFSHSQKGPDRWLIGLLYLQLGQPFNGLEWPQNSEDPQGLDGVDVLAFCSSVRIESTVSVGQCCVSAY